MSETGLDHTLRVFRAIGEETRLRITILLSQGELTVTELTQILGQSQPRVSRHIKILADAGVVERYPEGAWIFYRLKQSVAEVSALTETFSVLSSSHDLVVARDRERLEQVRIERAALASAYFQQNADEWDDVRRLHLPESDIEQAMKDMIGETRVQKFVDLGTGTGRMLIVFKDMFESGIGYDASREMLAVARVKLEEASVPHAQVRQGNLFSLPMEHQSTDVVCLHQVLHYLSEPGIAVKRAQELLRPGGRMLIADFASHELEFLRENHAHRRLGFSDTEVREWAREAGLDLVRTETLSPTRDEKNKLTVRLWLLSNPAQASSARTTQKRRAHV